MTSFDHLLAMSDEIGTFEHAEYALPRRRHGYCTDDAARVLVVVSREQNPTREVVELGRTAFRFLTGAQGVAGDVRNRRTARGRWEGRRGVEDCWGRSVWAFGTAAHRAPERWMRESALAYFERGVEQRSPWPRAMAFAGLGAAEVLADDPANRPARAVLADAATMLDAVGLDAVTLDVGWPWPEPRLTYANAALAEVLVAAGDLLAMPDVLTRGLELLRWLLDRETVGGHLSPTPVCGSGPGDLAPAFDQQPIEVAAMADACARAAVVTGDGSWLRGVEAAAAWFAGVNDAGTPMWVPTTGGGYDGLQADGPNHNQGAESTIALISTMQHANRLSAAVA